MNKRCVLSIDDALTIAQQALEEAEAGRATVFDSVKAALKARGLRYANIQLSSGPASKSDTKSARAARMAKEIKNFARPLGED